MILHDFTRRDTGDPDDFDPDGRRRNRQCWLGEYPWGVSFETINLKCINQLTETLAADYFPGYDDETRRGFKIAHALARRPEIRHAVLVTHAWAWSPERLAAFLFIHEGHLIDEARAN